MAGTYLEGVSKILSGVYTRIVAALTLIITGQRGVAAYCFTSDWGPINTLAGIVNAPEFATQYNGDKTALSAAKIYKHAFAGRANRYKMYRLATGAAAYGTCTLNDAGAAMSLTLRTAYQSARAFTAVVAANLAGGKTVKIVENGVVLCSVDGNTTAVLVAKLNATGIVVVTASGANLPADTAGTAFAGGNNGSTVTATEYSAFLTAVEADREANTVCLDAVTDEAILSTARTWVKRVRDEGVLATFVQGGPASWDADNGTLANAKSQEINYRGVINVGNGVDGYPAAEMAIYVAAKVAGCPLNQSVTDEVTGYVVVNSKLTNGQREQAKQSGTLIFVQDGASVVIDEGVNTLTAPAAGESAEFGKIRVSNTLDVVASDLETFGKEFKKGRSNTEEARETFAASVEQDYFSGLAASEVIKSDFFYRPDPEYHGADATHPAKIDEAFFYSSITPVDSMEKMYQKIGVNF